MPGGWTKFCDDHGIQYHKGARVRGGNVEIHCPFCGPSDRSHNLGLHLKSSKWGCWRDKTHSGRAPQRLIAKLLNMQVDVAEELAKTYFSASDMYSANVGSDPFAVRSLAPARPISPPAEFYQFKNDHGMDLLNMLQRPFMHYLKDRGYSLNYVTKRFDLRWCVTGKFANRLIIPIRRNGDWYTWTARSIDSKTDLRYMTADESYTPNAPSDFLYDEDALQHGGRLLVVLEGAFDAMKVASAFMPGVSATALFTKSMSSKQRNMILKLAPKYFATAICMDREAYADTLKLVTELRWYLPSVMTIVPDAKDPGAMSTDEIKAMIEPVFAAQQLLQELNCRNDDEDFKPWQK